jgi:kinesin family protein 2/24
VPEQTEVAQELPKKDTKTPFQRRIKPGMFVRLSPSVSKLEGGDIAMIMSPSGPEDFDETGEDRSMICAPVGPSIMTDAYELYVARQEVHKVKDMTGEVLMEYDFATRYYYMDL